VIVGVTVLVGVIESVGVIEGVGVGVGVRVLVGVIEGVGVGVGVGQTPALQKGVSIPIEIPGALIEFCLAQNLVVVLGNIDPVIVPPEHEVPVYDSDGAKGRPVV
jgi:hypothetical protein